MARRAIWRWRIRVDFGRGVVETEADLCAAGTWGVPHWRQWRGRAASTLLITAGKLQPGQCT
ncbi:MAG: hypothetical protein AABZ47_08630 [Planctomycetota bacterium]